MAGEDAKVRVGADVDPVKAAAKQAAAAWKKAGTEITGAFGDAARGVISDTANMVTSFGRVNLSAQMDQVRAFEAATARMATSAGADLDGMRGHALAVAEATGRLPDQITSWASAVGRLTGDFDGAIEAQRSLTELAAQTGRSVDDYKGLATQLGQVGVTGSDVKGVVASIAGEAAALGTTGGAAALADQFAALGDSVTQFSDRSTQGIAKVLGMIGTLGQGLDVVSQKRVAQAAVSAVTSDPRRWERYLGHHILDEHGHVGWQTKDRQTGKMVQHGAADVLAEIYSKSSKQFGRGSESQRNVLINNFGAELGMELFTKGQQGKLDAAAISKIATAKSGSPEAALKAFQNSDAGQRDMASVKLAQSSNDLLKSSGALSRAADALQQFSAAHPVAGNAAAVAGSGVVSALVGNGIKSALAGGAALGAKTLGMAGTAGVIAGGALTAGAALLGGGVGAAIGHYGVDYGGHASNGVSRAAQWLLGPSDVSIEEKSKASAAEHKKERDDRIDELERAGLSRAKAGFVADHERGQYGEAGKAQADELKAAVAEGIKQGMKDVKITTRQDTPIEVTASGGSRGSAGNQGSG